MSEEIRALFNNSAIPDNLPNLEDGGEEPILMFNCCYIVSSVILQDPNQVLLIQEAKQSCRGKWYLPAGRLEKNETLAQGAQREVEEESGFKFEPTSLICIEGGGPGWCRFSFTGEIVGGELKTWEDSESIQAKWFPVTDVLNNRISMRSVDVVHVIMKAIRMKATTRILPLLTPRSNNTITVLVVTPALDSTETSIVLTEDSRLPNRVLFLRGNGWCRVATQFIEEMGLKKEDCQLCGILNLAHDGRQGQDGIHVTLAYTTLHKPSLKRHWQWQKLREDGAAVLEHLYSDMMVKLE